MKFIRTPSHLLLVSILIISILILFISTRRTLPTYSYYDSNYKDLNILAHPEKYPIYDSFKEKNELNGTHALVENSTWIEFLPQLYIHSAFADETKKDSNETLIRITAIGPRIDFHKRKLQCVFQNNEIEWKNILDDYAIIPHGAYRYFVFSCISKNRTTPVKISLEDDSTQTKSVFLDVHYQSKQSFFEHELTVCILPIFKYPTNMDLLAEFLAYYDTVGVNSFIFYDFGMAKYENQYINMVSKAGINITVIPWTIQNATKLSRQRILEIASVQHCIFRNRGKTKYVLPIKIDEFLVPRQHFSLTELMNELSTKSTLKLGSFLFHRSNFCSKQSNPKKYKDDNLFTSRDIIREDKIWTDKKRSRYIARPEAIKEGGLNYVRKHIKGWISANVPWQLALIHHYTSCTKQKTIAKLIEDRTAESFKYEILLSKPMVVYREFKSIKKSTSIL